MSAFKIPGGRDKGVALDEADQGSIEWWRNKIAENLEADPGKKFADKDREWLKAADAELARRNGGGQKAPSQPRNAPRRGDAALVPRSFSTAEMFSAELKRDSESYNMVAPSTMCARLPEGFEGAISYIHVDPSTDKSGPGEVYSTGGKLGLSKSVLDKIGGALGASWDPLQSCRLDDGSDPRYVHYRAVGTIRQFDGTIRTIIGEKEMDLRPGSPQVEAIVERVEAANKKYNQNKSPDLQIREMRLHILGHAETKARLRAIRSLGIKTGYTQNELQKPFAVAKLMWTGHSEDPELRRQFAVMGAQAALGAASQAYGPPTAQAPQIAAASQAPQLHAPPPVGNVGADDSAVDTDGFGYDDYGQDERQESVQY